MAYILLSIALTITGMFIGNLFHSDLYIIIFGFLGMILPLIYLLSKIEKYLKK